MCHITATVKQEEERRLSLDSSLLSTLGYPTRIRPPVGLYGMNSANCRGGHGLQENYDLSSVKTNNPILLLNRNTLRDTAHLLQSKKESLGSQTSVALRLYSHIELVSESQTGERQIHALRLVQSDSHVLDEVLNEEAGVEVALDHAGSQVVDAPGSGGTGAHSSNHLVEVETGLVAVEQTLADTDLPMSGEMGADHHGGDQNLVHHLGVLAATRGTHVLDVGSHALDGNRKIKIP